MENLSLPTETITTLESRIAAASMMQWLGMRVSEKDGTRLYHTRFCEEHIGNPVLRALHGGVISAFLENAALLETFARAPQGTKAHVVSVHISYLAPAKAEDLNASLVAAKFGRRMGFFEATAYQDHSGKAIARAAIGVRLIRPEEAANTIQS